VLILPHPLLIALNFPLFAAIYYATYHDGPLSLFEWTSVFGAAIFICISISFSRVYCGMHCPTDILGGYAVGVAILSLSLFYMDSIDDWIMNGENGIPPLCLPQPCPFVSHLLSFFALPVALYCAIVTIVFLWIYPTPIYPTPSFDDSIAFGFVILGLVIGTRRLGAYPHPGSEYPGDFPFSYAELGPLKTFLRVVVGVSTILIWRMVAKSICKTVLPPLFRYFDYESSLRRGSRDQGPMLSRFNAEVATKFVVYVGIGWISSDLAAIIYSNLGLAPVS